MSLAVRTHQGRALLLTLLASCVLVAAAWAAGKTGSMSGKLIDPNGTIITGLDTNIVLTSTTGKQSISAHIAHSGEYVVSKITPGTYDIHIAIPCCTYSSYQQKGVEIKPGQALKLDIDVTWGMNLGTIGDDPGKLGRDMRAKAGESDAPTPRTAEGKPDLSGMWYVIPDPNVRVRDAAFQPPMKPWAAQMFNEMAKLGENFFNAGTFCLPERATPSMLYYPQKLIQTPDVIVHLVEFMSPGYRQIFLDGRPHPQDWNPSWMGHSVGQWQGDTLVVETVGFNDSTPGYGIHSEKLRVVERITRPSKNRLEIDITAEDTDAWTGPFNRKLVAGLTPGQEILEYVCAENNKDMAHFGGLGWKGRP